MPGGLLNLVSYGNQNIILNGNPSKTFFKCTYSKYTNFGLQKFRLDFEGSKSLSITEPSTFTFKVPRYGDLLMDTYLVINLPTIWSTILPPIQCDTPQTKEKYKNIWNPYEFKWIENLGTQIIKRIRFIVGGQLIQEFTGDYLYNLVERDFNGTKKYLYYQMTGNTSELNDPANAFNRNGKYPNVWPTNSPNYESLGPEPSIRSRKLYIPINIWFTLASKMAFPLVSLQYNELQIEIELRPVQELYVIRDVENLNDATSDKDLYSPSNYIQPNSNNKLHQFYRFLQPPPARTIENMYNKDYYQNQSTSWAADIHLISTYGFLSDEEIKVFASKPQQYLIKEMYQTTFNNVVGSQKINLESLGLISNWLWFFRRTDATLRNQWSNYTNWPYDKLPYNVVDPDDNLNALSDIQNSIEAMRELNQENGDNISFYQTINISSLNDDILVEFEAFLGKYIFKGYNNSNNPYYCHVNNDALYLYVYGIDYSLNTKIWAFTKKELTFTELDSYILTPIGGELDSHELYDEEDDATYIINILEDYTSAKVVKLTPHLAQEIPNPCHLTTTVNPAHNPIPPVYLRNLKYETGYKITGDFSPENRKDIMLTWGLILDGEYRENVFDAGVFNYIEKYVSSNGSSPDGLYCYNFGLLTSPTDFQPSGAINLSKFKNIEFEFTTYAPPLDPNAQTLTICDSEGNTIGINKPVWRIYDYTYDLIVMEERYNILTFASGNAGLTYAR